MHKMTIVTERYGGYMWALANRYSTGILSPEDIFQTLLVSITERDIDLGDDPTVKSFLISRSIDSCRHECRLRRREANNLRSERVVVEPFSEEYACLELKVIIQGLLPETQSNIICELAWPSKVTRQMAIDEALGKAGKKDGKLRMNFRDPHNAPVKKKHVAASLGVSSATVSRAVSEAQRIVKGVGV